jgi:hypothetical protein
VIYIKIELWPGGDSTRARVLSEGIIHNVGGDSARGNYEYLFSKVGGFGATVREIATAQVKKVLRRGAVLNFPRQRLYAHDLVFRALRAAFGERNPPPAKQACQLCGSTHRVRGDGVCEACVGSVPA